MSTMRILDKEAFRARRDQFERGPIITACVELCAAGDGPCMVLYEKGFCWECPGCGHTYVGWFGDDPVSGWDEPRWVPTWNGDKLSLTPSLGCSGWRDGTCPGGHYWLRDGELVPA